MQSDLHKELSHRAVAWLSGRTTRSGERWATEQWISPGYVADVLVLASLQMRFWAELVGWHSLKAQPYKLAFVFETKVSRVDFMAKFHPERDGERKHPVANLHYVVTSRELVKVFEVPDFWGLLEWSGRGLRKVKGARLCEIQESTLWRYGHQILWSAYSRRATIEDYELQNKVVAADSKKAIST